MPQAGRSGLTEAAVQAEANPNRLGKQNFYEYTRGKTNALCAGQDHPSSPASETNKIRAVVYRTASVRAGGARWRKLGSRYMVSSQGVWRAAHAAESGSLGCTVDYVCEGRKNSRKPGRPNRSRYYQKGAERYTPRAVRLGPGMRCLLTLETPGALLEDDNSKQLRAHAPLDTG